MLAEVRIAGELYTRNLLQAVDHLQNAGIPAVLIKSGLRGDHVSTSIDLVVSEQDGRGALSALADWSVDSIVDRLEYSSRAAFYPRTGPVLYLHTGLSSLGISTLPTRRLLGRACRNRYGVLVPVATDYLRIRLAQALSQDLALDLSLLLAVRKLMRPGIIKVARGEASREGWVGSFDRALATTRCVMADLDRGLPVDLPVPPGAWTAEDEDRSKETGNGRKAQDRLVENMTLVRQSSSP